MLPKASLREEEEEEEEELWRSFPATITLNAFARLSTMRCTEA
jgi:hypothetical protein